MNEESFVHIVSLLTNFSMSSSLSSSSLSTSRTNLYVSVPKQRIHHQHHHPPLISTLYCSQRRHHRRRRSREKFNHHLPSSPPDEKLQVVIDVENLRDKASLTVERVLSLSQLRFNQFVHSGNEAVEDLQTLIAFDADKRVIVSCRPSTLQFLGNLVLWSCVVVIASRVLAKLGSEFWVRLGFGSTSGLIRRMDRSLGGREVIVARKGNTNSNFRVLKNPLAPAQWSMERDAGRKNCVQQTTEKLPSWWPVLLPPPVVTVEKQEYQRMANRLIRAIMDGKVNGRDISLDDILELRRLCRTSGARVSIDTTNARESFYRESVGLVFDICGSAVNQSTSVLIDGEDAQQFIAGLADSIGLENTRAARIVSAAVAARTRSCFLQALALEMQGRHNEARVELSKISLIHRIFPPEECSPEMEMVARSLEKHLKLEQREMLMEMLIGVCHKGCHRSMAEALGLVHPN